MEDGISMPALHEMRKLKTIFSKAKVKLARNEKMTLSDLDDSKKSGVCPENILKKQENICLQKGILNRNNQ